MAVYAELEDEVGREADAGRLALRADVVVAAGSVCGACAEAGGADVVRDACGEGFAAGEAGVEVGEDGDASACSVAGEGVAAGGAHAAGEADAAGFAHALAWAGIERADAIAMWVGVRLDASALAGIADAGRMR